MPRDKTPPPDVHNVYVVTPWKRTSDLLKTRDDLYTPEDSEDTRQLGVDTVFMWESRGNLPHAILSTALLIGAQLHNKAGSSPQSVQATYGTAFARSVHVSFSFAFLCSSQTAS